MRVCYFGTYREEYSRNQIMIEGLRQAGVEVVECHEGLWHGIEDRVQAASGGWLRPVFWGRILKAYWNLLKKYRHIGPYDVMVVGYPGQFDVFLARLLTWLRRKPLAWDIFMSIYLISLERGLDERSRLTVTALSLLERLACRLPDRLILDTSEYAAWFERTHHVSSDRFALVPTGADDRIYHPTQASPAGDGLFRVLYYGTFIPNHGVCHIIEAARLLVEDPSIRFELIGDGPDRKSTQALADSYHLKNVQFVDWMDRTELVENISQADICLGAFGTTPQSIMTVQNKVYEGLAMAKPVITGDSPAVRLNLQDGETILLCRRQDPAALAEAIQSLKSNPDLCARLSQNGFRLFHERFDLLHNGRQFASHLMELIR